MNTLLRKARSDFNLGITTNGEKKCFDFHVSELIDSNRHCVMYIRPTQVYGILKLFKEKVPDVRYNIIKDIEVFVLNGKIIDEGQVILRLEWDYPFPGTGPDPTCFLDKN